MQAVVNPYWIIIPPQSLAKDSEGWVLIVAYQTPRIIDSARPFDYHQSHTIVETLIGECVEESFPWIRFFPLVRMTGVLFSQARTTQANSHFRLCCL